MGELHICDSEFASVRDAYAAKVTEIESDLEKYITSIKVIHQNKDLEGQVANKLLAFAELVEETINGELADIFNRYKTITNQYTDDIATSDDVEF